MPDTAPDPADQPDQPSTSAFDFPRCSCYEIEALGAAPKIVRNPQCPHHGDQSGHVVGDAAGVWGEILDDPTAIHDILMHDVPRSCRLDLDGCADAVEQAHPGAESYAKVLRKMAAARRDEGVGLDDLRKRAVQQAQADADAQAVAEAEVAAARAAHPTGKPNPHAPNGVPMPVALPGSLSVGHVHLTGRHVCPVCQRPFAHAHCASPTCSALWCAHCDLVARVDIGTHYLRASGE